MRLSLFLTPVLSILIVIPVFAYEHGHSRNLDISADEWGQVTRCDQIRVAQDGERLPVVEEDLPVAGLRSLRVRAARNGGIRVTGWSSPGYSVKACKASLPGGGAARATVRDNEVTSDGSGEDSVVFFLVRAPEGASLDLEASNGQLAVEGVNGNITARVKNGPLSISGSSGTIEASAVNGPVTFAGNSGSVKLRAENGPIAVSLKGGAWGAGSLDARTENGPVSLRLPRDFRSGVVVESEGHGPVSCRAEACREARSSVSDDERPRRIELGSGSTAVHIATVNGPVAIREQD